MLAAILELAPAGFEQVDGEDWVEFALYGAPGELPEFPRGPAEVAGVQVSVSGTEVADDWGERWREFHQPVLVGERVWVRPPWAEPRAGALDLVIDPARAFGTGAHPTTRLSLELLLEVAPRGPLTDIGCGSGVLAIAAARLGFEPVFALDNDPAATEATLANARRNRGRARGRRAARPAQRSAAAGAHRDRQPRPAAPARARAQNAREPGDDDRLRATRGRGG